MKNNDVFYEKFDVEISDTKHDSFYRETFKAKSEAVKKYRLWKELYPDKIISLTYTKCYQFFGSMKNERE